MPGVGSDSNYASIDVEGKIAVVRRGVTTFEDKIKAAERRGAVGVIIYNNVSGVISMSVGTAKIPACSIQMDYGNYLVEKGSGTMHFSTEYLAGPFMSNFSSWGPKADLELAPDITAHGGDIYSAVRGGYDTYSGTSMACPNMAGATILVREYVKQNYPELSNYEITELTYQLMMSTATIANNEEGNPYSPRKQGAGLADIASAIDTAAYLYVEGQNKTKLSLGDDVEKKGVYTMTFHLKNLSDQAVSYRVNPVVMTETMSSDGKTVAEKAYMFDDVTSSVSVKNGTVKGNIVTVTGYADCEITVVVTLSDADKAYLDQNFANGMYVEGFIELESMNADGIGLSIPFLAFYGDWTQAPLLDVTAYEVGAEQEDDSILEDDKLEPDVYATVPMGGFRYSTGGDEYEETYYYLGGFGYTLADGYEMPAIIEDKAAISSSMDATYSLYCISAGLLRNAKYAEMQIVDSLTGEVVFSKVAENNRKSYSNGGEQVGGYVDVGFYVNEHNLENNRKYTYSMTCYLDYDQHEQNNLKNTFSFSFYVDNEAPTLVEEDTRIRVTTNSSGEITSRALNMYAYDNHYIQGYFIYTYSSISPDGTVNDQEALIDGCIPVDGDRNSTTSISLDITNVYADILEKGGKLYVELIDYAKNRSSYSIDLNSTVKDVTDIQLKDGKDAYTLRINKQVNLNTFIDVYPQNTYVKDLIWTSSNEAVAIVKDGLVTGVSAGEAIITVANGTGEDAISQQIKITVSETGGSEQITLSSLKLKTEAVSLERGESYELTVELQPYNLTEDITLTWSSTSSYFSFVVDENDQTHVTITALDSGSGTLVVRANGKTISASCRITVKEEFEVEGRYLKSYTGRGDENGVVEIPDDLGILYIYRYAFFGNEYIKKIIIPEGVEEVEEAAIYNCANLEEVVFPESIKVVHRFAVAWNPELTTVTGSIPSIGELAFYNCPNLKTVDFSRTVFIEENAFFGSSSLEHVDLSNVVYVGPYSFGLCPALVEVITGTNTVISRYAFANCTGLTRVEINSSRIGSAAFIGCSALKSVTFNQPVETLDYGAFYGCAALEEVIFRSSVRVIDDLAFGNCIALTSFYIPAGVEDLGENAFGGCSSLEKVVISKDAKLTSIGQGVFQGAASLTAFELEAGAKYLSVQDGILYDKAMRTIKLVPFGYEGAVVLPDSVTEVGSYAFSAVPGVSSVTLNNVETIGTGAFYHCGCTEILSADSVKTIGDRAFSGSSIKNIVLPEGIQSLGSEAFSNCQQLTVGTLTLPESLTYVGEKAFAYTKGFTKVVFNAALTEVSDYMFYSCTDLQEVDFGNVSSIGSYAFYGCTRLKTIEIPDTVSSLGEGVFRECTALTAVTLPEGLEEIPLYTFYGCTVLRTLELPASVTSIGEYAFYGSPLADFDFGNVEAVGAYSFVGTDLTEIIASKLQTIGSAAFGELSLVSVELPEATEVYSYAFYNCKDLTYLYAPKLVTVGAFALSGTKLSSFASETVQTIESFAFAGCESIKYVSVPNLVTLGEQAFAGTGITGFEVGASLNSENPDMNVSEGLAYAAFVGAHSLAEITVADGNASFLSLDGVLYRTFVVDDGKVKSEYLELVAYPEAKADGVYTVADNTLRIAAYAFYDAANLEEVTLPVTLKSIGASAFESCDYLSRVVFLSAQAPELGGLYDEETGVVYKNFVTGIDGAADSHLTAVVPDNAVGYDTYIWKSYFASITSSGSSSPTENTLYLVKLIDTIPATVTVADRENIEFCRRLYNSFDLTQQGYVTNLDKLEAAEEALSEIIGDDQPSDSSDSSDSTGDSSSGTSSGTESGGNGGVPVGVIIGIVAGVVVIAAAAVVVVLKLRRRK